jgi:heme-degrading monooxygenase HmoA
MVLEIADFAVLPGTEEEFAAAVREGVRYVSDTPGFRSARLTRGVESPSRFVLLIEWDSLEAHTVGFRESENYPRWRELIGPFFDGAPRVEHFNEIDITNPAGA